MEKDRKTLYISQYQLKQMLKNKDYKLSRAITTKDKYIRISIERSD